MLWRLIPKRQYCGFLNWICFVNCCKVQVFSEQEGRKNLDNVSFLVFAVKNNGYHIPQSYLHIPSTLKSKHWLSTVSWFKSWVIIFTLGWKNILNQLENSGLKSRFLFCLILQFYLMYRLVCQKPPHFLSVQMALVSTFLKTFIILGMYNFVVTFELETKLSQDFLSFMIFGFISF